MSNSRGRNHEINKKKFTKLDGKNNCYLSCPSNDFYRVCCHLVEVVVFLDRFLNNRFILPGQWDSMTEKNTILANPAPLGLLGFGMTTVLLNIHNTGAYTVSAMILGMGIFYGGCAQIIAGIMEFKKGNTFGTTAFTSYGLFWISLVALWIFPSLTFISSGSKAGATEAGFMGLLFHVGTFYFLHVHWYIEKEHRSAVHLRIIIHLVFLACTSRLGLHKRRMDWLWGNHLWIECVLCCYRRSIKWNLWKNSASARKTNYKIDL